MFEFDLPPSIDDLETTAAPFEPVRVGDKKPESDPVVAEAEPRVAVASDHKPPGKRTRRKPPARAPPNRRRKRARRLLPLVRDAYSILEFCRAHLHQ